MGAKVYFFFLSGAKKGRIEAVETGVPIKIGRHHDCQIQLDPYEDIPASGHHAVVFVAGDGYLLEDAGSSWGTYKNDERLTGRVTITTGDVVLCGKDAEGREGPRLKFYLEKDVLRCPACEGPVYKRHFRCPDCDRKFCLRCIDFKTKSCKPCGAAAAAKQAAAAGGAGYEVVEDDAEAAKPARVVVSGKDAARAKQALQVKKPPAPDVVVKGDLDAPFCSVCCDFASEQVFTCPACRQTACVTHKHGAVCPPCAGVTDEGARRPAHPSEPELAVHALEEDDPGVVREPVASPLRRGPVSARPPAPRRHLTANELVVPDLDDEPARPAPSRPRDPPPRGGLAVPPAGPSGGPHRVGSGSAADRAAPIPGTARLPAGTVSRSPEPPPAPPPQPPGRGGVSPSPRPADPIFNQFNKIPAKRPQSIPCERCQAPLTASSFFVCDRCRARLCGAHRTAAAPTTCDACAAPSVRRPPPPSGGGAAPPRAPTAQAARPPVARPMATPPAPLPTLGAPPPRPPGPLPGGRPRQELIETSDDVQAQALRGEGPLGLSGQPSAYPPLSEGVRFECPYCDEPLAADARRCRHCGREL